MAPAANTAKPRKLALLAASDSESDAYEERLKEAEAARIRLRKAKEDRDKRREALALAYRRSLSGIYTRLEKSVSKYRDLQSAMHIRRLKRLKKAVDTRDQKLEAISEKLIDLQQIMVNHGNQLHALYEGRRAAVATLVESNAKEKGDGTGGTK